jgi:hypothetical protein
MEHAISTDFHKATFRGEWFPDDAEPLEGYTDGSTSGGWETPLFTREVLLVAIEAGLIGDPAFGTSKCAFDDRIDAFVFVSSTNGDRLPDGLDIISLAAEGARVEGHDYRVEIGEGFDVNVGGVPVHVYAVGSGLIWSLAED